MPCSRSVSWRAPVPTHNPNDTVSRLGIIVGDDPQAVRERRQLDGHPRPSRTARVKDLDVRLRSADVVVDGGETLLRREQPFEPGGQGRALAGDRLHAHRETWPGARSTSTTCGARLPARLAVGCNDGACRVRIGRDSRYSALVRTMAAATSSCVAAAAANSRRIVSPSEPESRNCRVSRERPHLGADERRVAPRGFEQIALEVGGDLDVHRRRRTSRRPRASRRCRHVACAAGCR